MRHAKTIKIGELKVGDKFLFNSSTYDKDTKKWSDCLMVGKVTAIRKTKKGRIKIEVNDRSWSNGALSPTSFMQD